MEFPALAIFPTILLASAALAQSPDPKLTFEVASVRAAAPNAAGRGPGDLAARDGAFDPQQVRFRNTQLVQIIRAAYNIQDFDQISGPAWIYDERFDIVAKPPEGATKEQSLIMLQNLLTERFKLAVHHVSKEFPAYELTIAKGGSKLKETADTNAQPPKPGDLMNNRSTNGDGFPVVPAGISGSQGSYNNGVSRSTYHAQTLAGLLFMIGAGLGERTGSNRFAQARIVDHTGLTGKYDFTLEVAGSLTPGGLNALPADSSDPAPDIFQALEKQLGLKLAKTMTSLDTIVIDHVEKIPVEN